MFKRFIPLCVLIVLTGGTVNYVSAQIVSVKLCARCNRSVPFTAQPGQACPSCGVLWTWLNSSNYLLAPVGGLPLPATAPAPPATTVETREYTVNQQDPKVVVTSAPVKIKGLDQLIARGKVHVVNVSYGQEATRYYLQLKDLNEAEQAVWMRLQQVNTSTEPNGHSKVLLASYTDTRPVTVTYRLNEATEQITGVIVENDGQWVAIRSTQGRMVRIREQMIQRIEDTDSRIRPAVER